MNLEQLRAWAKDQKVTGYKAFKDNEYIFTKPGADGSAAGTAFMAVICISNDTYAFLNDKFSITHQEIETQDITGFLQPVKE